MKRVIVLLVLVVGMINASGQGCLPDGIEFSSQWDIDVFQANYSGCTEIIGDVKIQDNTITNLNGLSVLNSIGGDLTIRYNNILTSLSGLNNLASIGGNVLIFDNDAISNITGMQNITHINGNLEISMNDELLSLTGLDNLTVVDGYFWMKHDDKMINLNGLNNLTIIGGDLLLFENDDLFNFIGLDKLSSIGGYLKIKDNVVLTSFEGLDSLISIGGDLIIEESIALTSLTGIENLTSIGGGISIMYNNELNNLSSLDHVSSIGGDIKIYNNHSLINLSGLDNITSASIANLYIHENSLLSTCDVKCVCDYLVNPTGAIFIQNNAPGCNNQDEVNQSCNAGFGENTFATNIVISPNPANEEITISLPSLTINTHLSIFNVSGEKAIEMQLTNPETQIDISALPRGVYFAHIQDEKDVNVKKFIKK
jgi:hypothetical protein